jgi:hypothetical protein
MMQPTDFGNRHDRAQCRRFDGPPVGRILVECEVSACAVIVREVAGQDAAQVALAQDEEVSSAGCNSPALLTSWC